MYLRRAASIKRLVASDLHANDSSDQYHNSQYKTSDDPALVFRDPGLLGLVEHDSRTAWVAAVRLDETRCSCDRYAGEGISVVLGFEFIDVRHRLGRSLRVDGELWQRIGSILGVLRPSDALVLAFLAALSL